MRPPVDVPSTVVPLTCKEGPVTYQNLLSLAEDVEQALHYARTSSTKAEEKWWLEEAKALSTLLSSLILTEGQ